MAKLSPLLAQWGSMKVLIAELAICLLLASLLGLLIGWLCKGAFARDKLMLRERDWEEKYNGIEKRYGSELASNRNNANSLTKRVEAFDSKNKALIASLDANKLAVQKANVQVQRLNNKQKETQTQLEKIIVEKDREISRLQKENARGKDMPPRAYGFSSNKPAEVKPLHSNRREAGTDRPSTNRTETKSRSMRDSSVAGGTPAISSSEPQQQRFKPGTQRQPDAPAQMDKTQQIGSGNNTRDTSNARPAENGSSRSTPSLDSTNHEIDATSAIETSPTTDAANKAKPGKRSLWDRVKGTINKDDPE